MKKTTHFFLMVLLIGAQVMTSCKKESTDYENLSAVKILTPKVKAKLEAMADSVFPKTYAPGIIALLSVEGEPDYIIKRGTSNLTTNEPMHENNSFRIASVTKTFTGTAVMMLADEGLIHLDSAISVYLPEYHIPSGDIITVRMLGNMRSGLFNYSEDPEFWEPFIASGYTLEFPPDSLLAASFRHPLNFPPGTAYEYSNTNTVLLGVLLEKITGKPAADVIREKVTAPLNLTNTYFGGPFYMHTPYTHGYTIRDEGMLNTTNWNPSWGYTAGAMVSNLKDMKKWARYLADGALLSEAMKAERFKFSSDNYGFCVELANYKKDLWVGHPGTMPGFNTQVWYNSARKTTLIVVANCDTGMPAQSFMIAIIVLLANL